MSDAFENIPLAGATPSAPQTPAAATPAAPAAPIAAATPQATPQAPASGAPGENWVPSYRVRETREAAIREANTAFAAREAELRAESDRYKSQLHSLVGVTPQADPQTSAVRDQFGQLYPGLSKLEERAAQVMEMLERSGDMESQNTHYWQTYGRQQMDSLFSKASESLGAPLTDEGKRSLHASYVGFVQSSPELTARYASDPTLVNEFWNAFTSSFIDPARRAASATVVGRAAASLPQDTPSGAPRVTPGPQPANLDERAAQAWAQYQQNAKG